MNQCPSALLIQSSLPTQVKKTTTSLYRKFKQLQGSSASLAKGTAVGVFIGIAPLMPFKSMLIVLMTVATGSSTVAALFVCTIICNPLTYVPLYYLAWLVGSLLLPGRADWETLQAAVDRVREAGMVEAVSLLGQLGLDAGIVLLTGGVVLALPLTFLSYPAALRLFVRIERQRQEKHLLNKKDEEAIH